MARRVCSLCFRLCAVGDAEAFGVQPGYLPELLRGPPHGAEAFCTAAQFELVVGNAHSHDLVVASAGTALGRAPRNRFDDELDGLEPALGLLVVAVAHANKALALAPCEFLGARLARAQALGITYRQYTSVLLDRGVHL